jgi:predicted RNase H-like HicB family nuclease
MKKPAVGSSPTKKGWTKGLPFMLTTPALTPTIEPAPRHAVAADLAGVDPVVTGNVASASLTRSQWNQLRYPIELQALSEEEGGGWFATIPLLGRATCAADGHSVEEVVTRLEEYRRSLYEVVMASPHPILLPAPVTQTLVTQRLNPRAIELEVTAGPIGAPMIDGFASVVLAPEENS